MRLNAIVTFRDIFSNSSFIVTIMFSIYVVTQICRSFIMSLDLPVLGNKYSILLNYRCIYIALLFGYTLVSDSEDAGIYV